MSRCGIGHEERDAWKSVLAAEDAYPIRRAKQFLENSPRPIAAMLGC
ncbi:MAG: hypothetical protein WCJ66_12305 [Verrucomicrobiota bacterium]